MEILRGSWCGWIIIYSVFGRWIYRTDFSLSVFRIENIFHASINFPPTSTTRRLHLCPINFQIKIPPNFFMGTPKQFIKLRFSCSYFFVTEFFFTFWQFSWFIKVKKIINHSNLVEKKLLFLFFVLSFFVFLLFWRKLGIKKLFVVSEWCQ
jgi:hypothetical protein